jgi:hypothetical protein
MLGQYTQELQTICMKNEYLFTKEDFWQDSRGDTLRKPPTLQQIATADSFESTDGLSAKFDLNRCGCRMSAQSGSERSETAPGQS